MATAKLELLADSRQVRTATSDLEQLNRTGTQSDAVIGTLRRAFVALGGAAVIGQAIKSTANFSQAVANLSAITGATGKDLEFYRQQAAEIGRTTTLSASQAVEAYQLIASASPQLLKNAAALDSVTRSAVTLAEATGQDLPTAARALGSAINQFQLDASKADEVINILAASSQLGTAAVAQVSEALRNAGPAAQSLGIDLAETVAGIQALAASGREGSDAGTALRQVLLRLEKTGTAQLQPSIVGLNGALRELASRNLSNTELMELFGDEAFSAATALLGQRQVLEELNTTLRGTNTAYEQAATRTDTLTADILALGSAIEGLTIDVFGGDLESLNRSLVQTATQGVNALSENLDTLTDVAIGISAIFGARMVGALAASTAATYAQVTAALAAKVQYDAMGIAIARTTVAMNANAVAARAGAGALALIGGPVGAAVLAAGGLAFFVTQAISSQREAERLANAALSLNKQLQETNNIYQLYAEQQSEVARSSLSGLGQAELQAQFDKSSKLVELYTKRLEQLRESGASLARQNQVAENLEQQKRIITEINALMPNATTSQQQFSEKLQEVTRSLEDQIFELENGKTAYELLNATRRAGVAIDSEEAAGIQALINRREQLVTGIRAQEEAERAARQAAQEEQQARENAASAFGGVQQGIAADIGGEAEQARQQLQARLDVIREYAAIEGADREAAMQAQLDAEQAFQQRLTEIRAQEEATRIQGLQNQLGAASQFFGDLNQLATAFGAEQKGINKALFVAQKAFSIAQSIIAIQTGIAQAAALPFPANLGAMATVASATAGIVSTIQGTPQPRAAGGQVLGGNQYLVGERGPELVTMRGNGNITPFNQLMRESGGSNVQVRVNVQNYSGAEVKTQTHSETLSNGQRREILDIIVGDITQRGRVHGAITSTTTAGGRVD